MTPSVARIVARFAGQLDFPLRWYSHVNCHRYERPQRGRVREHWQINCDIFGSESETSEIEIFDLVHDLMAVTGATRDDYVLRVNCRVIAESAMRCVVGVPEELLPHTFQVVDRWEKISEEQRLTDLTEVGLEDKQIKRLTEVLTSDGGIIDELPAEDLAGSNLAELFKRDERTLFKFDPLIIRAFEYYTSTVFEVFDTDPVNHRSLFGPPSPPCSPALPPLIHAAISAIATETAGHGLFPIAEDVAGRLLCTALHPCMSDVDNTAIARAITEALAIVGIG